MNAPLPPDEPQRLEALRALDILDTSTDPQLQSMAQLAADLVDAPIALVSLIDADRQWFKAKVGLAASETCRDYAFCAHAILQRAPLIVEDAARDERFAANPLVTSAPFIRFYCGVPLVTQAGHSLGTLCVIDTRPRSLTESQLSILRRLTSLIVENIETRSRLMAAEAKARRAADANFASEPLLAILAHELRTPLSHMMGFSDLVRHDLSGRPGGKESKNLDYLDIVRQSGEHLSRLIDNVDRIGQRTGHEDMKLAPVDLNQILEQVAESFAGALAAKQQALVVQPGEGGAIAFAEETAVRQIVINLISNASKYSPVQATIEVGASLQQPGAWCCLTVADDGPGISDDVLTRLGSPFVRGTDAQRSGAEGSGLGLYITQRLCETMKGSLAIERGSKGGTLARLKLPVAGYHRDRGPRAVVA